MKNLIKRKQKELEEIFKKERVILAYLFGSAGKGKREPLSDLDVAVLFSNKVKEGDYFDKELHLATKIGRLLKVERVDVVNLKTIKSPLLKQRATLKGMPIFIRDFKKKSEIEREILQEYEDTKYLRRVSSKIMKRQIMEGSFGNPLISIYK